MAISRLSVLYGFTVVLAILGMPIQKEVGAQVPLTYAQRETLVMTCAGAIEANAVDYTVIYSAERGFSRIEFKQNGTAIAAAQLSLRGKNDQNQNVWGGVTGGASDVILIHLSNQAAQPRDEISVGYNGQWGRGRCEGSYWHNYEA